MQIITAFSAKGWLYPDEYYQIIDFACYKLGLKPASELPWEYAAQMRSGLLPLIFYSFTKTCWLPGLHNPFTIAALLRVIVAGVGLCIIAAFAKQQVQRFVQTESKLFFVFCSFLLWYTPLLQSRFSAENCSGLSLLLSIYLIFNNKKYSFFGAGLALGFSFQFRYQLAICVLAILIYLYQKGERKNILIFCIGFIIVATIGISADYWLYHKVVFPPYYYISNIINLPIRHGVQAPWYYLKEIFFKPFPLFSILIFASLLYFFTKYKYHLFTFIVVPFFIFHQLIPHRELRFLYPIIYLIPFILSTFIDQFKKLTNYKIYLNSFFILNFIAALFVSAKDSGPGRGAMQHYFYQHQNITNVFHTPGANPFAPWEGDAEIFYFPQKITFYKINDLNKLQNVEYVLTNNNWEWKHPQFADTLKENGFIKIQQSVAPLYQQINVLVWFDNAFVSNLYKRK